MTGRDLIGRRVLVHQPPGARITDDGQIVSNPHDCSKECQHRLSRIVAWSVYHDMPCIATDAKRNANHADWPYSLSSLTLLEDDGEDWVDGSAYTIGDVVNVRLNEEIHEHPKGTVVEAKIESPHLDPEDWYVSFDVKSSVRGAKPGDTWRFCRVVNENDFVIDGVTSSEDPGET